LLVLKPELRSVLRELGEWGGECEAAVWRARANFRLVTQPSLGDILAMMIKEWLH
jgi:hypothetical protein